MGRTGSRIGAVEVRLDEQVFAAELFETQQIDGSFDALSSVSGLDEGHVRYGCLIEGYGVEQRRCQQGCSHGEGSIFEELSAIHNRLLTPVQILDTQSHPQSKGRNARS